MFGRTLSALTVMAALAGTAFLPATALAEDKKEKKHKQTHDTRFYDREHRDYHAWNTDEDHLYREWLAGRHDRYRVFPRMNRNQQRAYWQWRHDHR